MQQSKSPVSVCIDGWTNVKHEKVTNIIPICNNVAYYWTSIVNSSEHNTADWLYDRLEPLLKDLFDRHVKVAAIVADNESVMNKVCRRLMEKYSFLVRVSCTSTSSGTCLQMHARIGNMKVAT